MGPCPDWTEASSDLFELAAPPMKVSHVRLASDLNNNEKNIELNGTNVMILKIF
jgi:hypothetical protein